MDSYFYFVHKVLLLIFDILQCILRCFCSNYFDEIIPGFLLGDNMFSRWLGGEAHRKISVRSLPNRVVVSQQSLSHKVGATGHWSVGRDYLSAVQRLRGALRDQHSDRREVLVRGWRSNHSLARFCLSVFLSKLRGVCCLRRGCFPVLQEIVASSLFVNPLGRR